MPNLCGAAGQHPENIIGNNKSAGATVFQAGGQESETINEKQAGGDQTDPSLYLKGWMLLTSRPSQADDPVLHEKPEIGISVGDQILSWC